MQLRRIIITSRTYQKYKPNATTEYLKNISDSELNIIIFNGKPLDEDGIIGRATINAINLLDGEDVDKNILKVYSLLQKEYYTKIVINKPEQIIFLKGWFNRASA